MMKIENLYLKNALLTIGFYVLLFIIIYVIDCFSSRGLSGFGGLGLLMFFGIPIISGILIIVNFIRYFAKKNRKVKYSLILHLVIFIVFLRFFLFH